MSYIQITTRCNMTCAHCGMNATRRGQDMPKEVFKAAIGHAKDYGEEVVSFGGGEPTLHPMFWEFVGLAFGKGLGIWLATNGSQTEIALALAGMTKIYMGSDHGGISLIAELSQDPWHDPIDMEVVHAFANIKSIRDVSNGGRGLIKAGRAKTNDIGWREECICPGRMYKPDGTIRPCGCARAPVIGNVFDGIKPEFEKALCSDEYMDSECWTDYRRKLRERKKA